MYMRGALLSIDRPYGKLLDHLHHKIGSTHVAHHVDSMIPHYHAREATDAIAINFPKCYLFDPTPIPRRCGASPSTASPSSCVQRTGATRGQSCERENEPRRREGS